MKKEALIVVGLTVVLSLSGCGIYASAARSGLPKAPEVEQPNVAASVPEEVRPAPSEPAPIEPVTENPVKPDQPPASDRISKSQAESIALKHAGFTAAQVKGLKTELDIDPGMAHYEVEFRVGQWEYDYDIHAETGAILSYEKDD